MPTTKEELTGILRRALRAAQDCGLDTESWHLQHGSASPKVMYVLVTNTDTVKLGFTRDECWRGLWAMAEAWEMIYAKTQAGLS